MHKKDTAGRYTNKHLREGRRKEEEEEKREREKKKEGGEPGRIKQQSCEGKEREVRIKNKKRTMRSKGIERCSQTSDYSGGG
jgi:hypothetical protein